MNTRLILTLACLALLQAVNARADELSTALERYRKGDFAWSASLLRPLAEDGDALAAAYLQRMYYHGKGVRLDHAEAFRWAQKAAQGGNAAGEYGMALAYSFGLGSERNPQTGLYWLRQSAEHGNRDAQVWLAGLYLRGDGVAQDPKEAIRYLTSAAENGLARAMVSLAAILATDSFGIPADDAAAIAWLERAADARFFPAQLQLAGALSKTDPIESAKWLILASSTGCNQGRRPEIFDQSLSTEDRSEAIARARLWDKSHPPVDIDQFDQAQNLCNANQQRFYGPTKPAVPQPMREDTSGKGAVLCSFAIYASVEAVVHICGIPRTPTDDAISKGLDRIGQFIVDNSHPPVSIDLVRRQRAQTMNLEVLSVLDPLDPGICDGSTITPFRRASPSDIERSVDWLLSEPREPLMNPCL